MMNLDDIRTYIKQMDDTEIIVLLNEISDEVKRRNTIMKGILGDSGPEVKSAAIKDGLRTILEAFAKQTKF